MSTVHRERLVDSKYNYDAHAKLDFKLIPYMDRRKYPKRMVQRMAQGNDTRYMILTVHSHRYSLFAYYNGKVELVNNNKRLADAILQAEAMETGCRVLAGQPIE